MPTVVGAALVLSVILSGSCAGSPGGGDDAAVALDSFPDAEASPVDAPVRPTRVDILAVVSSGQGSGLFGYWAADVIAAIVTRLLAPPDGRPVRDLHFGVVDSKVDLPTVCTPTIERVINDGTLLEPHSSPPAGWPAGGPWPVGPFLTERSGSGGVSVGELAYAYSRYRLREDECSITQFLESAALALDGRNRDFVRRDSLLVVLLFADREDCSTADSALWRQELWGNEYWDPNARCYYPPDGLLRPVENYVKGLVASRGPEGALFVVVLGEFGKPTWWHPDPTHPAVSAEATCKKESHPSLLQPSIRLENLLALLDRSGDPRVRTAWLDPCPEYPLAEPGSSQLADRVLGMINR